MTTEASTEKIAAEAVETPPATAAGHEVDVRAREIVKKYMLANAGIVLIPLPLLDLVALAGVQLKMIAELSHAYNVPFSQDRIKSIVASLIGSLGTGTLATGAVLSLLRAVPGLGWYAVLGAPVMSAAVTYAVGKVFIQHYASGGTFLTFNPEQVREQFRSAFREGLEEAKRMKSKPATSVTKP